MEVWFLRFLVEFLFFLFIFVDVEGLVDIEVLGNDGVTSWEGVWVFV